MTQDDIDRKADEQLKRLNAWIGHCMARVAAKLDDAKAHAVNAVTQTLKDTPDGRATIQKVKRSSSYRAALARLDELLDILAGPSSRSLDGLMRAAREDFYTDAFRLWRTLIDESLWRSKDRHVSQDGISVVRGLPIHGLDVRDELRGRFDRIKRHLAAALAVAGGRSTPGDVATQAIDTWHKQSVASLALAVRLALSDGQVAADTQAARDLVHPDHLDDTPIEAD